MAAVLWRRRRRLRESAKITNVSRLLKREGHNYWVLNIRTQFQASPIFSLKPGEVLENYVARNEHIKDISPWWSMASLFILGLRLLLLGTSTIGILKQMS